MDKPFRRTGGKWFLVALCAAIAFVTLNLRMKSTPRQAVNIEIQVTLPLFVQVAMAAGDRYLAANIAAIRALWVDNFRMQRDEFKVLARVQQDVSWLNPSHEDNYYVATAVLPWNGELDATQKILHRATLARRFDYQPAFYYGFNLLHFKGDAVGASKWMSEAARYLPEGQNRLQMENLAAIWIDKSDDTDLAIRVVEAIAKQANRPDFRRYLELRVTRLRMLRDLRQAADDYEKLNGRKADSLQDLLNSRVIQEVPKIPFGFGFTINSQGKVVVMDLPPSLPN